MQLCEGGVHLFSLHVYERSFKMLSKLPHELKVQWHSLGIILKINKEKSAQAFKYPVKFYPLQSFFKGPKAAGKIQF